MSIQKDTTRSVKRATIIVNKVMNLCKFAGDSGFLNSDIPAETLSICLDGRVMDTYITAAYAIMTVLHLTPDKDLSEEEEKGSAICEQCLISGELPGKETREKHCKECSLNDQGPNYWKNGR